MNQWPRDIRGRELGGPDPLDRRLDAPRVSALTWLFTLLRTRSALGLAPSLTPAVVFLPVGVLLGPRMLGALSPTVLGHLDLAVSVALGAIGILVGLALGREIRLSPRLFAAASLESAVTIAAVAIATNYFIRKTGVPLNVPPLLAALALGLCASASSATSADPDFEPAAAVATRVADLDDVLPIAAATVISMLLPSVSARDAWMLGAAPIGIGLAVGAIGWLLFERAGSGGERAVFVLGTLGLTAGASAYLHVSPLTSGLIAGLVWTLAPGRGDRIVQEDLAKVQHPLVVLLLVTAGALWRPVPAAIWLLAPYLLFRLAGKVAGAWISATLADARPADLAAYLMSPGVLAIAFALNFAQMLSPEAGDTLLSTVAIGTAAFELFALIVLPRSRPMPRVGQPDFIEGAP